MKKIVLGIFVLLFMFAFAFTTIKVDAEEIVEEDTPTIEGQTPTNPPINDEEVDNVIPPVDNEPTTDDNTQEEVDKVPTIIIEEKAKEFTDYIIALVISFLGSSAFYAIVKVLTKKGINALTSKVAALDEQNKISADAKKEYENKITELEKQLNQATDKMDVVLNQIANYLEIDEQKQKEMAELLEKLLPPLNEDENKKDGE
jgi:hypothetical protein